HWGRGGSKFGYEPVRRRLPTAPRQTVRPLVRRKDRRSPVGVVSASSSTAKIALWPWLRRERGLLLLYLPVLFQHLRDAGVPRTGDRRSSIKIRKTQCRRLDSREPVAAWLTAQLSVTRRL